ncbi:MAG: serine--tRNA ligase [Bacteroidota bacterium]
MLQVNYIKANKALILERLQKRNYQTEDLSIIDEVIDLDEQRKAVQTSLDQLLAERNQLSAQVGQLFKAGKGEQAQAIKDKVGLLKADIATSEEQLKSTKEALEDLLLQIPNIPHESVPPGNTDEDNEVYKDWSTDLPELADDALPHWDLAEKYNIFDLKLGTKIAGAGFPVYRGKGARLQRALISFFLDEANKAGYEEIIPPLLVNEDTARATGQLPDKEGQMYYVERDNLYLIPTAEVPITNVYRNTILDEAELPIKMTGFTPCFRREAGSYGAHVRGLNRVHQFDKIEIVQIAHPEKSYEVLHEMMDHVASLLTKLELPFRILRLCGGDLGFTSALTFDFEVYSAAQKRWLEVSSVSNFETFQANRLKLRYKDKETKKKHLAHTLNGSALALARILASIMENNQSPEGIVIPKILQDYTGFEIIA